MGGQGYIFDVLCPCRFDKGEMERATTGRYQLYDVYSGRYQLYDVYCGTCMMQESSQGLIFVFLSQEAPAPDPHFFERLEKEVLKEIKKERQQAEFEAAPESARVAQLANELEKRDSLIKKLHVENELLVVCICVGCLCVCVCACACVLGTVSSQGINVQ